jgi:hypothetical protein
MSDRTVCTAAIAVHDAGGQPRLVGGGVCIRIAGQAFLLSAGEVLATVTRKAWIGMAGHTAPLYGAAVLGDGPAAPPGAETLKIGFAPLMPHDLSSPDGLACIPLEAVDLDDRVPGEEYVAIAARDARATAWTVIPARTAPPAAYRACGVDRATHVIVDVATPSEAPAWLGCGVWRRVPAPRGDALTGIVVDSRPIDGGSRTRVVATRTPFAVLAIFGFLGVRPEHWRPKASAARKARRTH